MAASRPVRIPRGPPRADSAPAARSAALPASFVRNGAGLAQARRLALVYVLALAALYLTFALLARRTSPSGGPGTEADLALFGAVAVVLAVGGAVFCLATAPRGVARTDGALVVYGPFGGRRAFPDGPGLSVRVTRRFPAGLLSAAPTEGVEIASGRLRRVYVLEHGLVEERLPTPVGR
ncbi:MAG TPA: hypothetical protein VMG36_05215 [Thermoplasmata archaeon]|nr:hypothetical protein [Thermoplasmata archaeon]